MKNNEHAITTGNQYTYNLLTGYTESDYNYEYVSASDVVNQNINSDSHCDFFSGCGCGGPVVPPIGGTLPPGCGWVPNIGTHEWEIYCDYNGIDNKCHDHDKPYDHGHGCGSCIYLEEYISLPIYYPQDTLFINPLDACHNDYVL